ncbi:STAS domain-containing protein [Pseudomarimonas salicorniae]|uniref:STAS domain-containing protein n=1 Tax=Pseudomarimonas salicorniae TaxID=2933270 RepID=A0ABT0GKR1_9GAMM|nr:STAS domain-containing protein [Lysobacter sp. CAU 1642]MCK7595126.1 STAS domain-containing protein [Lysobacter sp. CAU 1642]
MPPIELGNDLGIERASELKEQLSTQLDSGRSVVVDGSAVERVHGAGLQLLAAFFHERHNAGRKTRIESPSPALVDAARVMALTTALGLSESGEQE